MCVEEGARLEGHGVARRAEANPTARGDGDRPVDLLDEGPDLLDIEQVVPTSSSATARTVQKVEERLRLRAQRLARLVPDPAEPGVLSGRRGTIVGQPVDGGSCRAFEFHDPERVRQLFEAVETREMLVGVLDQVLRASGVQVTFGGEFDEPELQRLALVAAPYGERSRPLGVVGVIGPLRMDYARVIPLVDCLSRLVTESLRT